MAVCVEHVFLSFESCSDGTCSLPVPGLWLDVFQKIKALGYGGVSFYTYWGLLEGKPGDFTAEGIFAFDQFFAAAKEAGIYLLAVSNSFSGSEVHTQGLTTCASVRARTSMLRYLAEDFLAGCNEYPPYQELEIPFTLTPQRSRPFLVVFGTFS